MPHLWECDVTAFSSQVDGAVFGEINILGLSVKRTATVEATSLCDVRILHRNV